MSNFALQQLADSLKRRRESLGVTAQQMAQLIGIDAACYEKLEHAHEDAPIAGWMAYWRFNEVLDNVVNATRSPEDLFNFIQAELKKNEI